MTTGTSMAAKDSAGAVAGARATTLLYGIGVKPTVSDALGRALEPPAFTERLFYRWVRYPLMLGFLIAIWAAPTMSRGHLLFAMVTTLYVVVAIQIEERALVHLHGQPYRRYQRRVSMLLPFGHGRQN